MNNIEIGPDSTVAAIALALRRLMQKKAFDRISVSDITKEANIHRQTFYYHFPDKYALLNWICDCELIQPFTDGLSLDNLYDKLREMFTTIQNDKRFFESALKVNIDILFNYINELIVNQFEPAIEDIGKQNGISTQSSGESRLIAKFFGYGIAGVVFDWVSHGMKESPDELTKRIHNNITACKTLAVTRFDV